MRRWLCLFGLCLGVASAQGGVFDLTRTGGTIRALPPAQAQEAMTQVLENLHASCMQPPQAYTYQMPEQATALVNAWFAAQGYQVRAVPQASWPGTSVWLARAVGQPELLGLYQQTDAQTGAGVVTACSPMWTVSNDLPGSADRAEEATPVARPNLPDASAVQTAINEPTSTHVTRFPIGGLLWLLLAAGGGIGTRFLRSSAPKNPFRAEGQED